MSPSYLAVVFKSQQGRRKIRFPLKPFERILQNQLQDMLWALVIGMGHVDTLDAPTAGEIFDQVGDMANAQRKVVGWAS